MIENRNMDKSKNLQFCKYGSIPKEWECLQLKEVTSKITNGLTYDSNLTHGLPITRIETISDGIINFEKAGTISKDEAKEEFLLKSGDILYSHINSVTQLGKTAIFRDKRPIYHGMNLLLIRANDKIISDYLYYFLNSSAARKQAYSYAKRAVNQASISTSDLKKFEVFVPNKVEQLKIAKILLHFDKAITKYSELHCQSIKRKTGLEQQLLSGRLRHEEFVTSKEKVKTKIGNLPKDWELKHISDITQRVKKSITPEPETLYREIGIRSHCKGIFHKEEVSGASLGNKSVFWIQPDCFVVNIVFAWEHAIAKTTEAEVGMIASHRFPMYKPKKGVLDLDFLLYYFKTARGKHLLGLASPGGAGRNKTLGQGEFAKLKIPVPSLAEQKRIVAVLSEADREIELLKQQIATLKEQKKGLMQKLLTGEIRVNVK